MREEYAPVPTVEETNHSMLTSARDTELASVIKHTVEWRARQDGTAALLPRTSCVCRRYAPPIEP